MNMKQSVLFTALFLLVRLNATAQYWEGDHWYDNPLGFEPLKLHTSMGFLVPAAAVGVCLWATKRDTSLRNRLSIFQESGFSWGYKYPHTFLPQLNTGVNFQLRKWMSIGAEFDLYFPKDAYNSTTGIAIRPFARFYPVNREKWRCFFESGGGFVYTFTEFPKPTVRDERLGTFLNGTTKYGLGFEVNFRPESSILFGVRHIHISNGNSKGPERNPSHDSNGFFLGISHRL